MIGDSIYQYFPGYIYVSSEAFFITYIDGYIAIDHQVIFTRPSRDDLEAFSSAKLESYMTSFDLGCELLGRELRILAVLCTQQRR